MASEFKHIDHITGTNVALRDQYIVVGGETIRLPQPTELLLYLAKVRDAYKRWAVHAIGDYFLGCVDAQVGGDDHAAPVSLHDCFPGYVRCQPDVQLDRRDPAALHVTDHLRDHLRHLRRVRDGSCQVVVEGGSTIEGIPGKEQPWRGLRVHRGRIRSFDKLCAIVTVNAPCVESAPDKHPAGGVPFSAIGLREVPVKFHRRPSHFHVMFSRAAESRLARSPRRS